MNAKDVLIRLIGKVPFGLRSKIKNIPGLKQLQAYLIKKWVDQNDFVATISGGPAKGLVFPVKMPQDKQMWIGTWELEFAESLQRAVQPGWVCYDVGGYKGYYSGIMALKSAKQIFVFEPFPKNIEYIKNLIKLNPTLHISLQEYAVADSTAEMKFQVMAENTMGKLATSSFNKNDAIVDVVTVQSITLDEFIAKGFPDPDFIKIDVEGAEEFVLQGARDLMKRKKPVMMIEVHSPEIGERCLSILNDYYTNIEQHETKQLPGMESGIVNYTAWR